MEVPPTSTSYRYIERDISWLSFNHRVLQEAQNPTVPLIERLRFLAIYSSNLDEFFRVRVAYNRSLLRLKKNTQAKLDLNPGKVLSEIVKKVDRDQQEFGRIFREELIPQLEQHGIFLLRNDNLSEAQKQFCLNYFKQSVLPELEHEVIRDINYPPFLEDKALYFVVQVMPKNNKPKAESLFHLIKIPSESLPRFIELPSEQGQHAVIFLDDVIRVGLPELLPKKELSECYSIKLSRDAELYLEDELAVDLVEKVRKSLRKRQTGLPSRFLYDEAMPKPFLKFIRKLFGLKKADLIPGGRYHNFNDFWGFPVPDKPELFYPSQPPLPHQGLEGKESLIDAIAKQDYLLQFPYQTYDYVIQLLQEAAEDPQVETIRITLYRVAKDSQVGQALIKAARNGKKVVVFNEVQARFDEASNLYWGELLEKSGAKVMYSHEGLKVHTKIAVIERREKDELKKYAYLGTGNFNEKTAQIYCDFALLTADPDLAEEAGRVFRLLKAPESEHHFKQLLVAPQEMRDRFNKLIDYEIKAAKAGKQSGMTIKLNSLQDKDMVIKLYEASQAGVPIKIIVRGICCLVPGVKGMSDNIEIISIVDRYLEHGRLYRFHHGGDDLLYAASADWMGRNLSRRVEVGFPIQDPNLKKELLHVLELQWQDNVRARLINKTQSNPFRKTNNKEAIRAQVATYEWLRSKHEALKN